MKYNIDLNPSLLNNIMTDINNDIDSINQVLLNIINSYKNIGNNEWNSPEKIIIDQEFLPYLDDISKSVPSNLSEMILFLRYVLEKYKEKDEYIKKETEKL